ncbi:MAG: ribonuclease M5 [Anaerovorax sp.]|nr:ribonuclease M5 [Anaerovorax sp.]
MIREVIVVEGRDDESAVKRAVEAETIATHGFGIRQSTFSLIEKAYQNTGIIIFTDPDHAGERIRKRLSEKFPNAKHAYLSKEEAKKDGDIGIENASVENIREALKKVRCTSKKTESIFSVQDLFEYGLAGAEDAALRRDYIGRKLGIGYGNTKVFLSRLNHYGITREEFKEAWTSSIHQIPFEK